MANCNAYKRTFLAGPNLVLLLATASLPACDGGNSPQHDQSLDDVDADTETEDTDAETGDAQEPEQSERERGNNPVDPALIQFATEVEPVTGTDTFPAISFFKDTNGRGQPHVYRLNVSVGSDWSMNADLPDWLRQKVKSFNMPPGCILRLYSQTKQNGNHHGDWSTQYNDGPMYIFNDPPEFRSFSLSCDDNQPEFGVFYNNDEYSSGNPMYLYAYYSYGWGELPSSFASTLKSITINRSAYPNMNVKVTNVAGGLLQTLTDQESNVLGGFSDGNDDYKVSDFLFDFGSFESCSQPDTCFEDSDNCNGERTHTARAAFDCEGRSYCSHFGRCMDPRTGDPASDH